MYIILVFHIDLLGFAIISSTGQLVVVRVCGTFYLLRNLWSKPCHPTCVHVTCEWMPPFISVVNDCMTPQVPQSHELAKFLIQSLIHNCARVNFFICHHYYHTQFSKMLQICFINS